MAREQQEFPSTTLKTPLGDVRLTILGRDHIMIETRRDQPLTVNRVAIGFSLRLGDYGAGFELWRTKDGRPDHSALYAYRTGVKDLSSAARRKILETITPAVQLFAQARTDVLIEAERVRLNNEALRIETAIAELEQKLTEQRAELIAIEARERAL